MQNSLDVIVLGAGAAGLAAARRLSAAGLHVLVLEARSRVGGRIDTRHDPAWAAPIERGAEFVHGRPSETWDIVRAAGLQAYDFADVHFRHQEGRIVRRDDFWDQIESILGRLKSFSGEDVSFADFLAQHCADATEDAQSLTKAYVQGLNAADAREISAKSLTPPDDPEGGEQLFRLPSGYDALVRWLHAGCDPSRTEIRLNTIATAVRWKPGQVTVEANSALGTPAASCSAPRLVITLPLGVLLARPGSPGAIEFDPDLPAKRQTISKLRMGPVVKVLLKFHRAFWETKELDELGFLYLPGEPFSPWWTLRPMRAGVLTGWAGGPAAAALAGKSERKLIQLSLASLARSLDQDVAELLRLLEAWEVCDWQSDPFSRGAYAYIAVGGENAPRELGQPVDETLYFAGEATDAQQIGTVPAALASGYRAAAEILASRR